MKRRPAIDRFKAMCEFQPGSGCVLWTGYCDKNSAGDTLRPIFRYEGKRWSARRWAAVHVHGHDVQPSQIVVETCGDDRCVQHVSTIDPPYNVRQHWLLVDHGWEEREPESARRPKPDHSGAAAHDVPGWLA